MTVGHMGADGDGLLLLLVVCVLVVALIAVLLTRR